MRIDAHQHFWNYETDAADYGWIGEDMSVLRRNFGPDELAQQLSHLGFSGAVAVEARDTLAENDALLALAQRHDIVKAVVGWFDLCDPKVEADIARHADSKGFKGARMVIHDHPDPEFANSELHRRGVGMLDQYGLSYDLLLRPANIASATQLVDALPHTRFVIDHIAKPRLAMGWDDEWATGMKSISERPNVFCKLSGMVTEANWGNWHDAPYVRYLDFVFDLFGAKRLMIGSDWPVALLATGYGPAMQIVLDWAQKLSPDERAAIEGETCMAFYRIAR
jgi:L-fuconolactonase